LGLYFSVVCSLLLFVDGFSFEVGAGLESCFYEVVDQGNPIAVMFQVTGGGFLDIDVTVTSPEGKVIYSGKRENDGRYSFTAPSSGTYSFCFNNGMSTVTQKQIELSVNVRKSIDIYNDIATEEEISPLLDAIQQLDDTIKGIEEDQSYLKMREQAHRSTNESTNDRVMYWSIFEMLILIIMSIWQVYYLRKFFEDRRKI